jgi:hypothetical protein
MKITMSGDLSKEQIDITIAAFNRENYSNTLAATRIKIIFLQGGFSIVMLNFLVINKRPSPKQLLTSAQIFF